MTQRAPNDRVKQRTSRAYIHMYIDMLVCICMTTTVETNFHVTAQQAIGTLKGRRRRRRRQHFKVMHFLISRMSIYYPLFVCMCVCKYIGLIEDPGDDILNAPPTVACNAKPITMSIHTYEYVCTLRYCVSLCVCVRIKLCGAFASKRQTQLPSNRASQKAASQRQLNSTEHRLICGTKGRLSRPSKESS